VIEPVAGVMRLGDDRVERGTVKRRVHLIGNLDQATVEDRERDRIELLHAIPPPARGRLALLPDLPLAGTLAGGGTPRPLPGSVIRSHAKIGAIEIGIASDVGSASVQNEEAIFEDISTLRQIETLHHVLLDEKDCDPFGVDAPDQRE
jgi:hypothetical protein